MKKIKSCLLLVFLASISCGQSNDQKLGDYLVGRWVNQQRDQYGSALEVTLQNNGGYTLRWVGGGSAGAYYIGNWHVQDGTFICHITDWGPRVTKGFNGSDIVADQPPDMITHIRVLDQNHFQSENGAISNRQ